MSKIIYNSGLEDFLADLAKDYDVYVPSTKKGQHAGQVHFTSWKPGITLELNYSTTILPPTEFLLPAGEVLFSFDEKGFGSPKIRPQVLFGLSSEDLKGIGRLDKIMKSPVQEHQYLKRREQTYIIGVDKYTPLTNLGFDLYLQEFEPGVFAATAKTKTAQKWTTGQYFKRQTAGVPLVKPSGDNLLVDPDLPRAIKESRDHPIWAELAEICFGCGICSYVCPLCYCFTVEDEIGFADASCGERCRNWDSCMLKDFANTTHYNFRPVLTDRIYNWYYHKFYRMPREYGFSGCVDCNRCAVYCPAKINFHRVLAIVLADYKKRKK